WKASVNLQYSHQTYWDRRTSDYYTLSVNRYFDAFSFKNIALGLSASRSKYQNRDNDSAFVRLSVPWGTGTASYSGSMSNDRYNVIECDHGKLKRIINATLGFKSMKTAYATIKGIEVMRALRKGQASAFYYGDPLGEMRLVSRVFEM
ncbi:TPA: fimbria/pilus outer membrane usher protein, partial [Escherichia coli]